MPIGATCLAYPNLSKLEERPFRQWSQEVAIADQAKLIWWPAILLLSPQRGRETGESIRDAVAGLPVFGSIQLLHGKWRCDGGIRPRLDVPVS